MSQQPAVQAIDLAPLGRFVGQQSEQDVERIEDDPLRAHRLDLRFEDGQQAAQVEGSRLDEVGSGWASRKTSSLQFERVDAPGEARDVLLDALRASPRTRRRCRARLRSWHPWTRNCSAKIVLPAPGPPTISDVRPLGNPPPVI